jgi:hypothetical protein
VWIAHERACNASQALPNTDESALNSVLIRFSKVLLAWLSQISWIIRCRANQYFAAVLNAHPLNFTRLEPPPVLCCCRSTLTYSGTPDALAEVALLLPKTHEMTRQANALDECAVCWDTMEPSSSYALQACGHGACLLCWKAMLEASSADDPDRCVVTSLALRTGVW